MHLPICVMCTPLDVFSFMFPFTNLFNCSFLMFLNSFPNMYSGMRLPSLLVLILYGISNAVSPTCISKFAIISDHFLFKYNELIQFLCLLLGILANLYFHFLNWAASFALACLPKVSHLATCGAYFPTCWALSVYMKCMNCGQNFADRVSNSRWRVLHTCFSASVILSM